MVLGSETPVNIRKDRLMFIIYYAKDTAAHFRFPSRSKWGCSEKTALSAFSTYLTKNYGVFNILKFKEKRKKRLGLPFLHEILGYLAAVAWSNLDLPAAEFFDFAAYA